MTTTNSSDAISKPYNTPISITSYILSSVINQFTHVISVTKSYIYDVIILRMTETWYRAVLSRLQHGSLVLDVGVGTAGALLRCKDLIIERDLKVVGIDIDASYVEAGKLLVQKMGMEDRVSVNVVDVYDGRATLLKLAHELGAKENENGQFVDAVYFSGSFSLLPDPEKALQLVSKYIKNDGCLYITQTYQRKTPFFLPYIKPLMKYATTIDFGNLVREEEVLETFKDSGLQVLEHEVIQGSVDNSMQAAYLSVLR